MADYNLKDDLLGFGRSQLKYLLFHNTTLAGLTAYTHKKGLFFYDTGLDSVEILKNNGTRWTSAITMISSNDPTGYATNHDVEDRLVVGSKLYAEVTGFNPGVAGFLTIDVDGYPLSQAKITFEDILSSDYTTVITAPGVDTRFATEKAIVDYVTSVLVTPQDNILDWDGTKYLPFAAKKGVNPVYPYFYTNNGLDAPTFSNILMLDGILYATRYNTQSGSGATLRSATVQPSYLQLYTAGGTPVTSSFTIDVQSGISRLYSQKAGGECIPIQIGSASIAPIQNDEYITIDDFNQLFNINMTTVRLNKGTINKYLYLDASKNITYVDAPAGGVTPVDNILDWNTDSYRPYTAKTASAFYTGFTVPDAVATVLNYDGIFRATQMFEGNVRVMTTHGNWTANGSLHAVTTTSHAGFCPKLPLVGSTTTFLRADGTWTDPMTYWDRTGTLLTPKTPNDFVHINSSTSCSLGDSVFKVKSTSTDATTPVVTIGKETQPGESYTHSLLDLILTCSGAPTDVTGIGNAITFYGLQSNDSSAETSRIAGMFVNRVIESASASFTTGFEWWVNNIGASLIKRMEL